MSLKRLAILDMYDNTPNQGMRCIKEIIGLFEHQVEWELFDVRGKAEVPDLSFDIYISTGGPGSPFDGDGHWDALYYDWMEKLWQWNYHNFGEKKHALFICHSFQMACIHFEVAQVVKRKSRSFGIFPIHKTDSGYLEPLFNGLPDPFYAADFRDWQVIQPNEEKLEEMNSTILALEKIRPHVPLERAIMGIRFSNECIGLQFHPEADPNGMLTHFLDPERRKTIVEEHGEAKYIDMIDHLGDPDKIRLTHGVVVPLFLARALRSISSAKALV